VLIALGGLTLLGCSCCGDEAPGDSEGPTPAVQPRGNSIIGTVLAQTGGLLVVGACVIVLAFGFGWLDGVHLAGQALLGAALSGTVAALLVGVLVDSVNGITVRSFTRSVMSGNEEVLVGRFFYAVEPSFQPYLVAIAAISGIISGLLLVKETVIARAAASGVDVWVPDGLGEGGYEVTVEDGHGHSESAGAGAGEASSDVVARWTASARSMGLAEARGSESESGHGAGSGSSSLASSPEAL